MRSSYRKRRVHLPPKYQYFKPAGIPRKMLKSMILTLDEFEAIRLADYLGKEHRDAAQRMNISRPTFTRLIAKARQKVSKAIIDGMELVIEGGNIDFAQSLHRCDECGEELILARSQSLQNCPECGSQDIKSLNSEYVKTH
ncbi:MAG: DUF134 domain-containing protein [Calditrichaceae bacterium]